MDRGLACRLRVRLHYTGCLLCRYKTKARMGLLLSSYNKSYFRLLDKKSLFLYIISMADKSIFNVTSKYFYKVLNLCNSSIFGE